MVSINEVLVFTENEYGEVDIRERGGLYERKEPEVLRCEGCRR